MSEQLTRLEQELSALYAAQADELRGVHSKYDALLYAKRTEIQQELAALQEARRVADLVSPPQEVAEWTPPVNPPWEQELAERLAQLEAKPWNVPEGTP